MFHEAKLSFLSRENLKLRVYNIFVRCKLSFLLVQNEKNET